MDAKVLRGPQILGVKELPHNATVSILLSLWYFHSVEKLDVSEDIKLLHEQIYKPLRFFVL
jgi:hypothetical protein